MIRSVRASLALAAAFFCTFALHLGTARGATFTAGNYIIVDNLSAAIGGDASYTHIGFTFNEFGPAVSDGFERDRVAGNGGSSSSASFSFGSAGGELPLASGVYDVYASWKSAAQANLGLASYSATDGFGTVALNQSIGSLAAVYAAGRVTLNNPGFPADMVQFVHLGQAQITDGDFVLTLTDTATGDFVFSDAVAISLVPEPSGAILVLCVAAYGLFNLRGKQFALTPTALPSSSNRQRR
jgi:hypothetical protein